MFTALYAASLLLSGCSGDQSTNSGAANAEAPSTAPLGPGDTAGMDHSAMGHGGTALAGNDSPQLAAMNEMMQKMHALPMQGNSDLDFARHMLAHHQGAVVMAEIELRDGQDAIMRQMAQKIKADQQKEITDLEAVAARLANAPANYQPQNPNDPFASKMKASMDVMMQDMPEPTADPDLSFNRLMTVHHQSAVDMARAELAHGQDARLKQMAQQMVDAQQKEIEQFKAWHKQHADKM
ncbi:DUF305 domain-containing protein [Hymenobacter coalescens]